MKALTLEQLKSLKVGDWVWVVNKEIPQYTGYYKIDLFAISHLHIVQGLGKTVIPYATYGEEWFVWKNKEQAEAIKVTAYNGYNPFIACEADHGQSMLVLPISEEQNKQLVAQGVEEVDACLLLE